MKIMAICASTGAIASRTPGAAYVSTNPGKNLPAAVGVSLFTPQGFTTRGATTWRRFPCICCSSHIRPPLGLESALLVENDLRSTATSALVDSVKVCLVTSTCVWIICLFHLGASKAH